MSQQSSKQQDLGTIQEKLVKHIQNRQQIRQMYQDKGIQMLDKEELLFHEIQDPILDAISSNIYDTMKSELSQKGYNDFRYLGQGAQGLVVLAKEKLSNKRFAIKGILVKDAKGNVDQKALEFVEQEIQILNQCKGSPYVVNFMRKIEGKEYIYLVLTECLGTLNQIIQRFPDKKLNEISAIKYSKDIAEGLCFIHSKNCLVNDLKMDNILIDYNGNAVVSDFGLANNLPKQSGYALGLYMGNAAFQAPECYNPQEFDTYSLEYQKLGIVVKREPSQRSEACSLGYLIYTMISGFNISMMFNKHNPLQYKPDFQNFTYKKQLQYIIDGLTQFIPRNRFEIKDILIILKGIISLEFSLESKFVELMDPQDDGELQQLILSFKNKIEFVQHLENKVYPIIKNEKNLLQQLISEIKDSKKQDQEAVIKSLEEEIKNLNDSIRKLEKEKQQMNNQQNDIQPIIVQNKQANSNQVFNEQQAFIKPNESLKDISQKQESQEKPKIPQIQQNQMNQQIIEQQQTVLMKKDFRLKDDDSDYDDAC